MGSAPTSVIRCRLGNPKPEYRIIGMISDADMVFLGGVQQFLCTDYETVGLILNKYFVHVFKMNKKQVGLKSECPGQRRKRDSTDTYGFTSCSKK